MKKWMHYVIKVVFIIAGLALIVFAEIDDSPGGMLLGLVIVIVSIFTLVKKNFIDLKNKTTS